VRCPSRCLRRAEIDTVFSDVFRALRCATRWPAAQGRFFFYLPGIHASARVARLGSHAGLLPAVPGGTGADLEFGIAVPCASIEGVSIQLGTGACGPNISKGRSAVP